VRQEFRAALILILVEEPRVSTTLSAIAVTDYPERSCCSHLMAYADSESGSWKVDSTEGAADMGDSVSVSPCVA